MNELVKDSLFFGAAISILGYELGLFLKARFKLAVLNPLLVSIVAVMVFLSVFHIDYENYEVSARYLSYLLTPATVCLAVPLYQQLNLLKKHTLAISAGILAGVLTTMVTVLAFALLFHLSHEQYVTFLPKSITTAIGMGVSEEFGGIVPITVACIIITGIVGNVIAEPVLKLFGITEPVAKGIALGSSSHAIGTTKAIEIGEVEGAMSSLAIAMSGLVTVVLASVFVNFV